MVRPAMGCTLGRTWTVPPPPHTHTQACTPLPQARKSVGAECNWGVRLDSDGDAQKFLEELAAELSSRLRAAGVRGKGLTLKVSVPQASGHGAWGRGVLRDASLACLIKHTLCPAHAALTPRGRRPIGATLKYSKYLPNYSLHFHACCAVMPAGQAAAGGRPRARQVPRPRHM